LYTRAISLLGNFRSADDLAGCIGINVNGHVQSSQPEVALSGEALYMTTTAKHFTGPVKGAVNHIWGMVWAAVEKLAEGLTGHPSTRRMAGRMADRKDSHQPAEYAAISLKDAAAAIASASGKDAGAIERLLQDKLAKQPAVLKMIAAKKRAKDLGY
jgi:hypothetical protein